MNRIVIAAAVLCAGCSTVQTVVEADPVIAGKTYANNKPVSLGRVKMAIALGSQVVDSGDPAASEQFEVTIGFAAVGEPTSVVARSGAVKSKKDGADAELVGRFDSAGTSLGCVGQPGGELGPEYWFNGTVKSDPYRCVTLRFKLAGHQPTDPIELRFEPINVGGELVRTLPVTFAFRTEQIKAD